MPAPNPQPTPLHIPFKDTGIGIVSDITQALGKSVVSAVYDPAKDDNADWFVKNVLYGCVLSTLGLYDPPTKMEKQLDEIQRQIVEIQKKLNQVYENTEQILQKLVQAGYQSKVDNIRSYHVKIETQWNWYTTLIERLQSGTDPELENAISEFADTILEKHNMQENMNQIHDILTYTSLGTESLLSSASNYLGNEVTIRSLIAQNGGPVGVDRLQEQALTSIVELALLDEARATTMIVEASKFQEAIRKKHNEAHKDEASLRLYSIPEGPIKVPPTASVIMLTRATAENTLWQNVRQTAQLIGYPLSSTPDRFTDRFHGSIGMIWDADQNQAIGRGTSFNMQDGHGFGIRGTIERNAKVLPIQFWEALRDEWASNKKGIGFTEWLNKKKGFAFDLSKDDGKISTGFFRAIETLHYKDYLFASTVTSEYITYQIPILTSAGIDYQETRVHHALEPKFSSNSVANSALPFAVTTSSWIPIGRRFSGRVNA